MIIVIYVKFYNIKKVKKTDLNKKIILNFNKRVIKKCFFNHHYFNIYTVTYFLNWCIKHHAWKIY